MALSLFIWDFDSPSPTPKDSKIVLWQTPSLEQLHFDLCMPDYLEDHSLKIRDTYLSLIAEIGDQDLGDRSIVSKFQIRPQLSFWWLTQIAEKCNWHKSPYITDALKMIALDFHFKSNSFQNVIIHSNSNALIASVEAWGNIHNVRVCRGTNTFTKPSISHFLLIFKKNFKRLFALLWLLKFALENWRLRGLGQEEWRQSAGNITFIDYLIDVQSQSPEPENCADPYWAHLPDILHQHRVRSNWLHVFVKNETVPNARQARSLLESRNKMAAGREVHVTLSSFLELKVLVRTLIDWMKIQLRATNVASKLQKKINRAYLWPLLKDDWHESFSGKSSIQAMLMLTLLEKALNILPKQSKGFYLRENVGWEFALINSWQENNHGAIYGIFHSTVSFWDMRTFQHHRVFNREKPLAMPLPDFSGCNSEDAYQKLIVGGIQRQDIIKLEALRYLHLLNRDKQQIEIGNVDEKKILVIGDYNFKSTQNHLRLLADALPMLQRKLHFILKCHRSCPINPDEFPTLNLQLTNEPLASLLPAVKLVYGSPMTSASVEAFCYGLKIITSVEKDGVIMSPLRESENVLFTRTSRDLGNYLNEFDWTTECRQKPQKFFILNRGLHRWKKVLLNDQPL